MLGAALQVGEAAEVLDEMDAVAAGEPQPAHGSIRWDAGAQHDLELSTTRRAAGRGGRVDAQRGSDADGAERAPGVHEPAGVVDTVHRGPGRQAVDANQATAVDLETARADERVDGGGFG